MLWPKKRSSNEFGLIRDADIFRASHPGHGPSTEERPCGRSAKDPGPRPSRRRAVVGKLRDLSNHVTVGGVQRKPLQQGVFALRIRRL